MNIRTTTKAELLFWIENIHRVNGQPFQRPLIHQVFDIDLDTDASKKGWGAVLYLPEPNQPPDPILLLAARQILPPLMTLEALSTALHSGIRLRGEFSFQECKESSNARELMATLYSFKALLPFLHDLDLNHQMDNLGAVKALGGIIPPFMDVITGGSNTPRIQEIVIQIDDCCIQANIQRHTLWVPRDQNIIADYMSKLGSGDAYSFTVLPWVKELLERNFGPYTIDRFASYNNVQVVSHRYNSLYFEPDAEWIDAFSCHWNLGIHSIQENNWIHPPYLLVGRVLQHISLCKAHGTVILPRWESAPWWHLLASLLPTRRLPTARWTADVLASTPVVTILELGIASNVLCFPSDSTYGPASLPHGHILAVHFKGTSH